MIECKICNKKFKTITNTHLRDKHNMSVVDYKSKFNLTRVSPEGWMKGEHNSFYGLSHKVGESKVKSKEYREAARKRRKGKTPKEFLVNVTPEDYTNNLSKALSGEKNGMYGRIRSEEYKAKLRKSMKGSNNPNWKGGFCREPYSYDFDECRKNEVRKREEFKCFLCSTEEEYLNRKLDVHHIDYNKKNSAIENLVALCSICHAQTKSTNKKDLWIYYFTMKLHKRYGNQKPSQPNGEKSRLEGSETTKSRTPINNTLHERPASY